MCLHYGKVAVFHMHIAGGNDISGGNDINWFYPEKEDQHEVENEQIKQKMLSLNTIIVQNLLFNK